MNRTKFECYTEFELANLTVKVPSYRLRPSRQIGGALLAGAAGNKDAGVMNAFDRDLDGPASLHFGDGEYVVLKPGGYVLCAASGKRIPLDVLRYWSVERQEAYCGPAEVLLRQPQAREVKR